MDLAASAITINRFEQPDPDLGPLGFRQWRLVNRQGRTELGPASLGPNWVPGTTLEAECPKLHRAGHANCSCGFHIQHPKLSVTQDLEHAILNGSISGIATGGFAVAGAARGWGRVTVENEQVRTELARVEALFFHEASDATYRALISSLAEIYEAELVEVESAAGMLNWLLAQSGVITPDRAQVSRSTPPVFLRELDPPFRGACKHPGQPLGVWPESLSAPTAPFQSEYQTGIEGARIIRVAGMTHHPGRLPENASRFEPGQLLKLVPEPENRHDRNAIAVLDESSEVKLGYLPRDIAPSVDTASIEEGYANLLCLWQDLNANENEPRTSAHLLLTAPAASRRLVFPG